MEKHDFSEHRGDDASSNICTTIIRDTLIRFLLDNSLSYTLYGFSFDREL